ncbi:NAD(P)H-hydrate dehydratase [Undibacterium sp. SXout7W]|uniref:NAD(P)H-hydrate dehydratase n=1 Tax=Undibacterium sp. SXout7W TaxID=3413049 RepID=UPI003BF3999F
MTDSAYELPWSEICLYSVNQIRAIESSALSSQSNPGLMQKAGYAAALCAQELISNANEPVLVIAGPGNNGGDAFETAFKLSQSGVLTTVIQYGVTDSYSADAKACLFRAKKSGVTFMDKDRLPELLTQDWSLIIDGLFGIGLQQRASNADILQIIQTINAFSSKTNIPVLALDVPSGLNADTGQPVSGDQIIVRATHTITFIGNKPGLHTGCGKDVAGKVSVNNLDIKSSYYPRPTIFLNSQQTIPTPEPRQHNSHKGSYGDVIIAGGAQGMSGAVVLAARAALYTGAGRVFAGFLHSATQYDSQHPELMCRNAHELDFCSASVVVGPGLGQSAEAIELLRNILSTAKKMVIDADALNLIALHLDLQILLKNSSAFKILTPHPLEAARLMNVSTETIQNDRLRYAKLLAEKLHATVILKGSGSIIADPDGSIFINTTGNPALATGGTGDVLAGVCGTLLEQSATSTIAAQISCWIHGHAADVIVQKGTGPIGITASELIPEIRNGLNNLTRQTPNKII